MNSSSSSPNTNTNTTNFKPSTETYSSYMARLAQTAFKNKMASSPSKINNNNNNSNHSNSTATPTTAMTHRRPPPPPPPPQQQQYDSTSPSRFQQISIPTNQNDDNDDVVISEEKNPTTPNNRISSRPLPPQNLPRSPPPPSQTSNSLATTGGDRNHINISAIQSSATEFLNQLNSNSNNNNYNNNDMTTTSNFLSMSASSSLSKNPYATTTTTGFPSNLRDEILALQVSSPKYQQRTQNQFPPYYHHHQEQQHQQPPLSTLTPQRSSSSSALMKAFNNLKQTPIARSSSTPAKLPPQPTATTNAISQEGEVYDAASMNNNGSSFFEAAQGRLSTSQDFSSSSRISKYLSLHHQNQQHQQQLSPSSRTKNDNEQDTQKIEHLFSNKNNNTDLENLRRQMPIVTSYNTNNSNSRMKSTSPPRKSNNNKDNTTTNNQLIAARESLQANINRSAEAQRKQHLETERMLDQVQHLNRIEQRLTDHQNEHTKLRAQRLMDLDRARWEVQRVDFRVLEVQSHLDAACSALQERLLSRIATVRQLQDDAVRQNEMRLQSAVKGEHDRRIANFREQTAERSSTVESLRVALQQLSAHVEVQCARIEHDLSRRSINATMDKLTAIRHALNAEVSRSNHSVESMVQMVQSFAVETKKQLDELREERLMFHERMARRVEEMRAARLATDARHRAKVATPSSFRAPSL